MGTTNSFDNTPQATDDVFTVNEDTGLITLNVMANDLGGNAKTLYSIDDGTTSSNTVAPTDLLIKDSIGGNSDVTAKGARISITADGKISYDLSSVAEFQKLAAGEKAEDSFIYAIRLGNGTLSWAKAVIVVIGVNDAPQIVSVGTAATGAITELAGQTASSALGTASGKIAFADVDLSDTHTASVGAPVFNWSGGTLSASQSAALQAAGTLALTVTDSTNSGYGSVGWSYSATDMAFDFLGKDQTLKVTYQVSVADNHGGTVIQNVVITVTGVNDKAVISDANVTHVQEDVDVSNGTLTASGKIAISDADAGEDHFNTAVVGAQDNIGSLTLKADGSYTYSVDNSKVQHLGANDSKVDVFTVTAADGTTKEVKFTVTGTNDGPVAVADIASGTENQALSIDVLANDTDADDDHVFTLVSGTAPTSKGSVAVANNQLVFTPGADFDHLKAGATEQVTLSYTMKDDQGATSTSSVVVTVTGTNDAPVAVADTASGTENQALNIDVLANDTDVDDGHVFTLVSGTAPASKGSVAVANNQLVFAPGADFDHLKAGATEQVTLSYTMKDDQGVESTSSVVVTVTGTNDAPVAIADTASGTENQALNIDVLANDTDADDDHVFTLVSGTAPASKGLVAVANNQLVFTPGSDFDHLKAGATEQVTLSYTMKDDQGVESTSSVVVTVTGTNDAPVAVADIASGTENQTLSIDVLANDTDADDGHVFELVSGTAPAGKGTTSVVNNQLVFTPGSDFDHLKAGATEQVTLSYTMKDDQGVESTSSVVVTVTGTNDAPVAVADTASGTENQALSIDVLANDTDVDDGHVFTLVSGTAPASKGSVAVANNQLVFTPGADFDHLKAGVTEQVTLSYTMKDDQGVESTSSVVVTVTGTNDAPVAVADTASGTENQVLTIDVLANDTDADDDHVFTLVSGTAPQGKGTTSVVDNHLMFTPGADFDHLKAGATEQVTLNYTMKDEQGATSTSTVVVTVTGSNDAPVAVADTASGTENQALSIDVLANDTDADDDHVFTLVSGTAPASKGSVAVANNQLVFTPGADFDHLKVGATEQVTLSYTMKDDQGATSTSSVVVTVTGTNDAPIAVADTASGTENQVLTIDVLANDTDADDDHVFTLVSGTAPASKGSVAVANNQLVFTPGSDFDHLKAGATEQVTLSYTMKDDQGATSTSSVVATVTGTNDAPIAVADTASGTENQVLTIDVLANDTDADDDHVFTLVSGTAPASKGSVAVANNQLVFTPGTDFDHLKAGATEQVTLNYTMKDEQGATSTSTVVVTVTGTNDAPVAVADTASGTENQALNIDVLANDTDVDDGHVFTLVSGTAPASKGSVAVANNQLVFTPGTDFDHLKAGATEQVTLNYTMKDDQGVESTSSVVVTVTGTNDAPVAVADIASGTENQALSIDVLANDTDADDDHVFTLVSGTAPASKGSVAVANNQLVFTPGADFDHLKVGATEQVTLNYTMKDEQGATSTSSVVVTVTGTNDVPVAVADTASGTENQVLTIDVLANDTDADDDHVFTLVSGTAPASKGSVAVANNQLVFTPGSDFDHLKAGATEQVTLNYTMKDEQGATSTSSVVVTVTGTNDAPTVAAALTAAANEDAANLTVNLLQGAADADDGAVLTVANVTGLVAGVTLSGTTLTVNPADASFQHLAAGVTQNITVNYDVVDEHGAKVPQSATITITGTNDAPTVAAALTAAANEDSANLTVNLLQGAADADDGATLSVANVTGLVAGVTLSGTTLTVDPADASFQHLAQGVTQNITVNYDVVDEHGAKVAQSATITITGTNDTPTVTAALTAAANEDAANLTVNLLQGAADADDGATLSVANVTGLVAGVTLSGTTLTVNPADASFQHLAAGVTQNITVNYDVVDEHGAKVAQSATITITGTNDVPTVAAALTAAANEDAANLTVNLLQGAADADDGATLSVANVTGLVAGVTLSGTTLTVNPADASFQHLAAGATQNITVNYDVVDEHGAKVPQSATITITGTNDVPTVAAALTAAANEDAANLTVNLLQGAADADDGATLSVANVTGLVAGVTLSGSTLTVDPADASFQHLAAGATQNITVNYDVVDEHGAKVAQSATITITGTNDAAVIGNATVTDVTEDTAVSSGNLTASGSISISDADAGQATFTGAANKAGVTNLGTLALQADGSYVYSVANAAVQYLGASDSKVDTFTVTAADGTTKDVSFTIHGTNDAAILSSDTKNLIETNSVLSTGGTLSVTDVDSSATFQAQSNTAGTYGTFSIGANGAWTYATTAPHNEFVSGTTYTETFQVLSADGTATSVTVNIAGTDETAVAITAINADSGSSSTDFVTNDTSLTVSGSHGTLNAGEKIQVSIDGGANWTDVTSTSATTWSYTDPAIHAASFEYQARVIDAAGGVGNTASQAVTIDTTADAGPAATLAVGDTLVNNSEKTAVNYTVAGLDSDATAVVTVSDGTHTSTHTYAANGAFTFDLSGFNDGAITSSMLITDIAGNTKNVTGQSTTLDTTADGGANVTIVLNDGDGYINKAETGAASYTISGVDSDATATVRFSDGNAAHDVVVTGLGNVTSTVNLAGLTDGPISATVSVSDTAGNLATGTSDSSVKDATSPTLTSVALQNPATATTSADVLVFRVTFSEAVSGVDTADFVVSGTTAAVSAVTPVATGVYDVTVSGGDLANLNGTVGLALKSANGGATIQDAVGNTMTNFAATGTTASYTVVNAAPDTTADAGPTLRLVSAISATDNNNFTSITLKISGFDSDLASATITLKDSHSNIATHTLLSSELATAKSNGNDGSVTISNWTGVTTLNKNDTITATIAVQDATGNQASHSGTFDKQGNVVAPAGAAGEPIQLALSNPEDHAGLVTVNVANLPSHWTLSEGSRNADGTWTVQTSDPSKLAVTSPADFAGAVPLTVSMQWTKADGTIGSSQVTDNVEVYALGSPIFALSNDDNLTASSAADLLVFAQPIAHDTIYSFDTAADKIDLIGFTGVNGFADLSIADDASGNAVITLANGSTITVAGVHAASLGAGNFAFNVEPTTNNAGTLTISDGAIMPFGGVINNTGTVALASSGNDTKLEVLVESLTLQGGGHVTLSDSGHNMILGGAASAKLVNIDNTISGAGQIGAGQMTLDNHGIIVADGSNALTIDTGANTVANSGTLEATGSGGLVIDSALDNSGKLWANGGNVTVHGDVSGSGSAVISGTAVLELDGAANVAVSFDAGGSGSLKLGDADHFSGSIAGFGGNDSLRLADIAVKAGSTLSFAADASGGTLTVGDGTSTAHLALLGSYANAGFVASADQGGMLLTANVADANQNLHGTDGIDLLASGAGNDILAGGAGNDVLFGGGGSDTFVFDTALNGASNVDTILDFQANGDADYILLSQKVFGSLTGTGGTLDAWQFAAVGDGTGASALLDAGVHLIYDSQTGSLFYDADGANTVEGRTVLAVIGTFEHPSGAHITHDVFKFG